MTSVLNHFAAILDPRHILSDRGDISGYERDGRQGGGRALAVLRPGTAEQISAIMRVAAAHHIRIVPQGARTGLVGGGMADDKGDIVLLSLDRMNAAPVIDPFNRSVQAEAGVTLSMINAIAGEHGLFFPIDLGADPSVGGMISANTGGARFLRYGDVRRNILAMEVVLADAAGTIVTLGSGVWKDNSGIDLKQLFTGASGSLGIVTRATLALQPKPVACVTALVALQSSEAALELLLILEKRFGTLLTAFEGMSETALNTAFHHVPRLRSPFAGGIPPYAVLIEVAASAILDDDALENALGDTLTEIMEQDNSTIIDIAVDRRDGLWAMRHAIPEGLRTSGQVIACDISLKRGDVMRFRSEAIAEISARWPGLRVSDFGHIGDGGLHFNMVWPHENGLLDPEMADSVRDYVFTKTVTEYGGSFSAEHGVGPRNIAYYKRFVPKASRDMAGTIQKFLAPAGIGRVDFG